MTTIMDALGVDVLFGQIKIPDDERTPIFTALSVDPMCPVSDPGDTSLAGCWSVGADWDPNRTPILPPSWRGVS